MNEAETAQTLREALRRYSQNSISPSSLGIFKGIEQDGVIVKMQLKGINLRIMPAAVVDVAGYEKKIEGLEETVKEQGKEIASLKKEAKKKPVEEIETEYVGSAVLKPRRRRKQP